MDGAGPRALGRTWARTGVPVVMGLVSGAVSLGAMAASLWITRGDGQKYLSAALTILATGWSLLVTACLLWPGLGTADPDTALPAGFEGQRLQFELLVLAPWPWSSPPAPSSTWPAGGPHDLRAVSGSVTNPATSATTAGSRRIR
jgi:hypothetical protein